MWSAFNLIVHFNSVSANANSNGYVNAGVGNDDNCEVNTNGEVSCNESSGVEGEK